MWFISSKSFLRIYSQNKIQTQIQIKLIKKIIPMSWDDFLYAVYQVKMDKTEYFKIMVINAGGKD